MITIYVASEAEKQFAIDAMEHELVYNKSMDSDDYQVIEDEGLAAGIAGSDPAKTAEYCGLMYAVFKRPGLH